MTVHHMLKEDLVEGNIFRQLFNLYREQSRRDRENSLEEAPPRSASQPATVNTGLFLDEKGQVH
jgi:hypothetical protein